MHMLHKKNDGDRCSKSRRQLQAEKVDGNEEKEMFTASKTTGSLIQWLQKLLSPAASSNGGKCIYPND